jgi:uncharacterized protein with HEPN domain
MIEAAMLKLVEEAGTGVLVLADGLDEAELLGSRLTRAEVRRQLEVMAATLAGLSAPARDAMPELDWDGWRATRAALAQPGSAQDDALWFAVRSLVPATLTWLRVYRHERPELFAFTIRS